MNNEPVAWINEHGEISQEEHWAYPTPLYTHPAKTEDEGKVCARCGAIAYDPVITQTVKTLTDEDVEYIVKRWINCHPDTKLDEQFVMPLYSVVNLCKAILKKASEK